MSFVSPAREGKRDTSAATIRVQVGVTIGRGIGRRAELVTFRGLPDEGEHVACVVPSVSGLAPLVRLHSECLTGDVFGSERCDCGPQLDESLKLVGEEGGIILYLRQEGRGIGLYNKLDTYLLQDQGANTYEANRMIGRGSDERNFDVAAAMLRALGERRIRLFTNNPDKVEQLRSHGIEVEAVIPTSVHLTAENHRYLSAKSDLFGHALSLEE